MTLGIFGVASHFAPILGGALIAILALAMLILFPAFAGKTIAQMINRYRDRKAMNQNHPS